jgi:hypothetical protein
MAAQQSFKVLRSQHSVYWYIKYYNLSYRMNSGQANPYTGPHPELGGLDGACACGNPASERDPQLRTLATGVKLLKFSSALYPWELQVPSRRARH